MHLFSCDSSWEERGLMVSSKRTNLAEDTVEDLLMIKLNLEKVENLEKMEARGKRQEETIHDG